LKNYLNYINENINKNDFIKFAIEKGSFHNLLIAVPNKDELMQHILDSFFILYNKKLITVKLIKFLIENKFNMYLESSNDDSILMLSVRFELEDVVEELIKSKINLNIKYSNGDTALICAIKESNYKIAKMLIDSGADVNLKNYKNLDASIYARSYLPEIEKLILKIKKKKDENN